MSDAPLLVPHALTVLERTPATLRALFAGVPDDIAERADAGGWSAKDVVAHLASVQQLTLVDRIGRMLNADEAPLPNVDEDEALAQSGLRGRPVSDVLDEFATRRAQAVAFLRGLAPGQFGRTGRHEVAGRMSAADMVHHAAWHDLLHVAQAAALIGAPLEAARGAMRVSYPAE